MSFEPTPKKLIETVTEEIFRESSVAAGKWRGAGRKFFVKGTSGYVDNLLPVNDLSVRQAVCAANERLGGTRPVELWDVGCANGRALYQLMRTVHQYENIDVIGKGWAGNESEFLKNAPVHGTFEKKGNAYLFTYKIADSSGNTANQSIEYSVGDIHKLESNSRPDVIMSMACIKYSHDPWKIFSNLCRLLRPNGQLYVGHLVSGTGSRASRQPIYDKNQREITPREYVDALVELNPGISAVSNEDFNRKVSNEENELVYNHPDFYARDVALNAYRQKLIESRKNAEGNEKAELDKELLRVSGNGFFNVSLNKGADSELFFGLLYVGKQYGEKTEYLFVPDKKEFERLLSKGFVAV